MPNCGICETPKTDGEMVSTNRCRTCYNAARLVYQTRMYVIKRVEMRAKMLRRYHAKRELDYLKNINTIDV